MKSIYDRLALLFAAPFITLLAWLPTRPAVWVAHTFLSVFFLFFPRIRSVAYRNLELMLPETTLDERDRIWKKSFWVLAKNLVSFAKIPQLTPEYVKATMNWEHPIGMFERLKKESGGKGVIIATAHFGSFEGIVARSSVIHEPIAILARGFDMPILDTWWNKRRGSFGNKVFARKGGYRELVRNLNEGRDVGILVDQNVKRNHAIFVPFFNIPAATTKSLGLAVETTGAKVVFVTSFEQADGNVHVDCNEIPFPSEGTREERMLGLMSQIHRHLEDAIRRNPEQWFWIHRRLKTRPAGEPETLYSQTQ